MLISEIEDEKFTRIMNNLLVNALEAMPGGGSLSVKVSSKQEELYIDISDTGSGIPEEIQSNPFKPFYSTKTGHSGLGLAFCKNALESVGGSLSLESTSSKGTTFRIILPLRKII